jgi:hypothetical protein
MDVLLREADDLQYDSDVEAALSNPVFQPVPERAAEAALLALSVGLPRHRRLWPDRHAALR